LTTASIRQQLRGYAQYYPDGWDDAAGYFLANRIHLEEALKDEERSIQLDERFDNLLGKSKILDALGRNAEATTCLDQAMAKASAVQLYSYGRQLQGEKKSGEAFALYRSNAKKFPEHWTSHLGLARVFSSQSDFDNAVKEMKLALAGAPKENQSNLENALRRLQAREDINR
jgi:tetratricopeptide (TPR) repeat protein